MIESPTYNKQEKELTQASINAKAKLQKISKKDRAIFQKLYNLKRVQKDDEFVTIYSKLRESKQTKYAEYEATRDILEEISTQLAQIQQSSPTYQFELNRKKNAQVAAITAAQLTLPMDEVRPIMHAFNARNQNVSSSFTSSSFVPGPRKRFPK